MGVKSGILESRWLHFRTGFSRLAVAARQRRRVSVVYKGFAHLTFSLCLSYFYSCFLDLYEDTQLKTLRINPKTVALHFCHFVLEGAVSIRKISNSLVLFFVTSSLVTLSTTTPSRQSIVYPKHHFSIHPLQMQSYFIVN